MSNIRAIATTLCPGSDKSPPVMSEERRRHTGKHIIVSINANSY